MVATLRETTAPCSSCVRVTAHKVLHQRTVSHEDRSFRYAMLECSGCRAISLGEYVRFDDGETEESFYPSPVSRKEPEWLLHLVVGLTGNDQDSGLGGLLHEIYQSVHGGQYRLAAMGVRALLEQVMISRVGDQGSFERTLDTFQKEGYVSFVQRDALRATLEVGHAAMHRAFTPTADDLKVALDVLEGVMAPIFHQLNAAERMIARVPPRRPRSSK
jgi:hypothetical protein